MAEITSVGVYKAELNGEKLGKNVLAPGYTSYDKRILYQTYDMTDKIADRNGLDVTVAPGCAVGHLGYDDSVNCYSDHVMLTAELTFEFADGTEEVINIDETWQVYTSPVLFADIYDRETLDATHEPQLLGNALGDSFDTTFSASVGCEIKENERIAPREYIVTPKNEKVVDFGQNMTGYVEFSLKGKRGDRVVISFAEVLDKDGNFYNDNYRTAKSRVTFVLDGSVRRYKPEFSFQGFRYIRIEEYPDMPVDLNDIRAVAVYTDMRRTGYFACGDGRINRLYRNIVWGQKSNYLDIPTDCPQRNERLGWTGDTQVFCRTAAMNYDVEKFFDKWLADLRLDQREDGAVWGVCPE